MSISDPTLSFQMVMGWRGSQFLGPRAENRMCAAIRLTSLPASANLFVHGGHYSKPSHQCASAPWQCLISLGQAIAGLHAKSSATWGPGWSSRAVSACEWSYCLSIVPGNCFPQIFLSPPQGVFFGWFCSFQLAFSGRPSLIRVNQTGIAGHSVGRDWERGRR